MVVKPDRVFFPGSRIHIQVFFINTEKAFPAKTKRTDTASVLAVFPVLLCGSGSLCEQCACTHARIYSGKEYKDTPPYYVLKATSTCTSFVKFLYRYMCLQAQCINTPS